MEFIRDPQEDSGKSLKNKKTMYKLVYRHAGNKKGRIWGGIVNRRDTH